jgi:hypothetical protein
VRASLPLSLHAEPPRPRRGAPSSSGPPCRLPSAPPPCREPRRPSRSRLSARPRDSKRLEATQSHRPGRSRSTFHNFARNRQRRRGRERERAEDRLAGRGRAKGGRAGNTVTSPLRAESKLSPSLPRQLLIIGDFYRTPSRSNFLHAAEARGGHGTARPSSSLLAIYSVALPPLLSFRLCLTPRRCAQGRRATNFMESYADGPRSRAGAGHSLAGGRKTIIRCFREIKLAKLQSGQPKREKE